MLGRRGHALGVVVVGFVAILLRFVWIGDYEYKADQTYSFEATQQARFEDRYPPLGMPSSQGLRNPGASVWAFSMLSDFTGAKTPVVLSAIVALWSLLGVLAFAILIRRFLPTAQRGPWTWGLAAMSLAPQVIRFHRVIWAQSLLLPYGAACFYFFFKRKFFWGAFGLAFVGLLIGQIHMPGFFLFASGAGFLVVWQRRSVHWMGFALGGLASALLMVPWFEHVFHFQFPARSGDSWANLWSLKFWLLWFSEPFTDGFRAVLGSEDAWRFFKESAWIQVPLGVLGFAVLWRVFRGVTQPGQSLYRPIAFASLGYGLLLTVLGTPVYRHYLEATYPLPYVMAALAISKFPKGVQRIVYPAWVAGLAILSFQMLWFLHRNGGAPHGDYGVVQR